MKKSTNLSLRWASRSKKEFGNNNNKFLFGIVQGGIFDDLRIDCLKKLKDISFDGYAIGGLAVGESQLEMFKTLDCLKNDYLKINHII